MTLERAEEKAMRATFEEVACELCGSRDSQSLYHLRDYERGFAGEFHIVACTKCRLVFLNPRPTPETIGAYYTPDDWYRAKRRVSLEEAQISNRPWREIQAFRCRPILLYKQTGSILDIGCGDGLLLKFLSEKGWDCHGIETGALAVQYAITHGLDVKQRSIESASFPENSFDVMSLFASIEHLHHPLKTLRKISSFLKKDGILYVGGIPNFDSFERKLFGKRWMHLNAPRHLYHFTPKTMALVLKEAGYQQKGIGFYSYEGRTALGYTESLRHFLSDGGLYPPKRPEGQTVSPKEEFQSEKRGKFHLLDMFHFMETSFFMGLGKWLDRLGKGGHFWIVAEKE